jgi:hypothetical protein
MNIIWYYRRLKSMCPGEVVWRVGRLGGQISARLLRKQRELRYKKSSANSRITPDVFEKLNFYGLTDTKPEDVPSSWYNNTVSAAEKLLQHRCNCLALGEIDLGEKINWNHEYKRNIDTPLLFGPWMDYRDTESYGDFKYFWELPRFQHLITLAKAYYLTGSEKYAKETANQIKTFIEQSPYLLGVNGIMPMEAAIRLISLSWITNLLKRYLRDDKETGSKIDYLIRSHTDYVARNFSLFSSANNHLVAELAGVFIASTCFPFIPKAEKYRRKTYKMLCREIINQFYADGVNKEQTTHYHIACYNCFLLAGLLGKENGMDFPSEYWETLEQGANFICAMMTSDNSIPNIGDCDDGKTVLLSETNLNHGQSLLSTAAVMFNRSDFKAKAGEFSEMSFWLLGKGGMEKFQLLPDAVSGSPRPVEFEEGGYYIFEAEGPVPFKLIFDSGPLGFGDIAAHGHADALSFVLYVAEKEFFIDPGTYTFVAKDPFRNHFRSTSAHNTLVVDELDQSEMTGPFLWTKKAQSSVEEFVTNEHHDRIVASHNGYSRQSDAVIHRRCLDINKELAIITIEDRIEAKNNHLVTQCFHFSPDCQIQIVEPNEWRINNGDTAIRLIVDQRLDCQVLKGSVNPIAGWSSRSYDRKTPAETLLCKCTIGPNDCLKATIKLQD